ncbi:spermatogenesis-associated protein 17-like [Cimex lectularius]|uniref:Spermatogenesis-associated protein 17 n=1 Tax=Cimex lectularius TaxID=79782 RepID=A0A8I6S5T3_CIMLE|nr:spermatogenesis-associated protein 17-like [Cimex lectularius]
MALENRTHIPLLVERIINKIRDLKAQNELKKREQNKAAIKIQKYVRGFITRRHLQFLHECAIVIQKYFRGYKTRKVVAVVAKFKYDLMVEQYHHMCATKIQSLWRGYNARKNFNYYKFKKWLDEIIMKNKSVTVDMIMFKSNEMARKEKEMIQDYNDWIEFMATKLHHLLRTKVTPGIYSKKGSSELSEIEKYLKKFKYSQFMEELRDERVKVALEDILKTNKTCARTKVHEKCLESYRAKYTISNPAL